MKQVNNQVQSISKFANALQWLSNSKVPRTASYMLSATTVIAVVATVTTMLDPANDMRTVMYLLYADLILLLLLSGLLITKLLTLWNERQKGHSGAGFHTQLVLMFSLIAVTPAVLVAIFAAVFLNVGLQGWFSDKVKTAIEDSRVVAAAYLHEHQQTIRAEAYAMANDINRQSAALSGNQLLFNRFLSTQARIRNIPEAVVADTNGKILARSQFSMALEFDLAPKAAFEQAKNGETVILTTEFDDRVRAIIKLNRYADAYLLVGRFVDPRVIEHINRIERGVNQYKSIEKRRGGLQITFIMLFIMVAVMLLLAAAWVGLNLATQFATPISRLVAAAEQVHDGDLNVQLDEDTNLAEVDTLIRTFNKMISQLSSQQEGLLDVNRQLDERRRFTETVLTGVTAGVIGLDQLGHITLPNRSASDLLEQDISLHLGERLSDVVPEMQELLETSMSKPDRMHQNEIHIDRNGNSHSLMVRIAAERLEDSVIGYVVTFDDITALQSAQRQAAWSDVARRIAHEIKNPLTPIQLSAERLKRKYLKEITSDPETFQNCTDTIVRQVADIGRMVDEFSSFARMPEPSLKAENLSIICREGAMLETNRSGDVQVHVETPPEDLYLRCDRSQLSQAITNLLKNAIESVTERLNQSPTPKGLVTISLTSVKQGEAERVIIKVDDNGIGLPENERNRLTEPYVTTRDKGTGLGLAIVKKIVEDHEGDLTLSSNDDGGARVSMAFWQET